jgi:phage gp29-like protein
MRLAREKGIKIEESRAHKQLATWFKNREVAQKYASGELKVPTPQERQAQLAKQQPKKEKVDEYGANNPAQATTQKASPAQIQQVAANLNTQKTALNQLKQINPEIDPQKAATAVTKDVATMSPQEKEELAQVAKTLSPALGTPALGTIKTAIQKSQLQAKK